jgi:hypothetical protein
MTFGHMCTIYVRVCGTNDLGHICDEYLIMFAKLGIT